MGMMGIYMGMMGMMGIYMGMMGMMVIYHQGCLYNCVSFELSTVQLASVLFCCD